MADVTILQLNDLHGYIEPHTELVRDCGGKWRLTTLGGASRIAGLFDQVRAERPGAVIALDNGDTFHGTHVAVASKGLALVPITNALGFDAMTVHWEFAYGPSGAKRIAEALDYPILAANVHHKADDALFFPATRIVERDGLKIGIVGLACPIVDKTMPPAFSTGLYFTIGVAETRRWIDQLRQNDGVDLIIVLSHLGFPQDMKLAGEVDGIDVLLSGHTHNRMHEAIVVNGAIIMQSGCHGAYVGRLDLSVAGGCVVNFRHELIPVDDRLPDHAGVATLVAAATAQERSAMDEVVGTVDAPLHRYAMLAAPMDDLLLEAIATAAGTEIAFSNGWRYGAPIAPGPVTMRDLWNIIPTNPPVSTVMLTGHEMRQMLEENLESTFAADPFRQMGGYVKRMRGVRVLLKAENPFGRRIEGIYAEGAPLEPDRCYRVAFVTAQGVPARFGTDRQDLDIHAIEAMRTLLGGSARPTPSDARHVVEMV
jgi:2',3'-cyclic-nucleotide 2'-phosphodiesterase (5'-nucleotidase family)